MQNINKFRNSDLTLLRLTTKTEPPVMIVEPKDDIVMESYISEDTHLQCELSRSSGKVQWFKNGQLVEESDNIQLISEGPYRRLTILNGTVEDGGEYICETDGDSVFFQLTVKGKAEISLPIILCIYDKCVEVFIRFSSHQSHR